MSEIAIRTENLSKRYHLGARQEKYKSLRDSLSAALAAPFRRKDISKNQNLWALKDITLEIHQGEAVGIIGRNGAGKSTLLRLLARITRPTNGRAWIHGRVGSLLEVGTGFHQELTGRENIYLNGAILGMRRHEIRRKYDEIVDFAEIEQFLDTPVKRYSSGMYMRLAFAVAAHLEPEILLVDEVLAVGDVAFQKKCLGKMGEVAHGGRTVLFVSHNMDAVSRLCPKAIYLENGHLVTMGASDSVIENYLTRNVASTRNSEINFPKPEKYKPIFFKSFSLFQNNLSKNSEIESSSIICRIKYEICADKIGAVIAIRIDSLAGTPVMTLTDNDTNPDHFHKTKGTYHAICPIPTQFLAPGFYRITLSIADMKSTRFDYIEGITTFEVAQNPKVLTSFRREGSFLPPVDWKINIE